MNKIILVFCILFLTFSAFGQNETQLNYYKVTEYIFDNKLEDYKQTGEFKQSGAISIGQVSIIIKGYNAQKDKTLKVLNKQKEPDSDRDLYVCEINGKKYAIALSPDLKYLTQIGVDDKYIYELTR